MTGIRGGARTLADRMSTAARAWLTSLDDEQLGQGAWPWEPDGERLRWFYTPTDHGGLPLRDMRPAQQSLAMQLVAAGLSRAGYVTVSTIMGLENVLDQLEDWQVDWGRERGRDPQLYWLRIFGEPDGLVVLRPHSGLLLGAAVHGLDAVGKARVGEVAPPDVRQRHQQVPIADPGAVAADDVDGGGAGEQRAPGLGLVEGPHEVTGQVLSTGEWAQRVRPEQR